MQLPEVLIIALFSISTSTINKSTEGNRDYILSNFVLELWDDVSLLEMLGL